MSQALVALALAVLAGFWLTAAVDGRRDLARHGWGYLGTGFLLGSGLVALVQRCLQQLGVVPSHLGVGLALVAVTAASGFCWLRYARLAEPPRPRPAEPRRARILGWGFVGLVALQYGIIVSEGLARPVFPWDAWSAWSVKAKVWIGFRETAPFVSFPAWLAAADPEVFTNEAWRYPELVPRLQLWVLQWPGRWLEPVALLPWAVLWGAMLALFNYGLREAGLSLLWARATLFLVSALPIAMAQVALPGYLDLWVATALLAASVHLLRGLSGEGRRPLLLVLLLLPVLIGLKLEGLIWALILTASLALALLRIGQRRALYVAVAAAALVWWLAGGFAVDLGTWGRWIVTPGLIDLPYVGRFRMEGTNTLPALTFSFLMLPNWHLLWYAAVPAAILGLTAFAGSRVAVAAWAFVTGGAAFLVVLFFFTHASTWVDSMTASNRLALHYALPFVFWVACGLFQRWNQSSVDAPSR